MFLRLGNSASLVIILVLGLIWKDNKALQFILCAALSGVMGIITMLGGMRATRERIAYENERKNPLEGFGDILRNKYAWNIIVSEFLKSFRGIANFMGTFLAAALLGDSSKFLLFGLPTGIGTAVGMLIINFLLKKFDSRVLYIASGIYSLIANTGAFLIGYTYFKQETSGGPLRIVFIVFLFLIGLQFGAVTLMPMIMTADCVDYYEYETGKRMEGAAYSILTLTIKVCLALGTAVGLIFVQVSGYYDALGAGTFTTKTKDIIFFAYTALPGVLALLSIFPMFKYDIVGEKKAQISAALSQRRAGKE